MSNPSIYCIIICFYIYIYSIVEVTIEGASIPIVTNRIRFVNLNCFAMNNDKTLNNPKHNGA